MAKNKKKDPLDGSDIKKYLVGEAIQRHELEKKLLTDSFANDALEGYEALKKDKIDEKAAQIELKDRLNARIKPKTKSRVIIWKNVSIAAAVMAILGVSYMYFTKTETKETLQAVKLPTLEKPKGNISDGVISETTGLAINETNTNKRSKSEDIALDEDINSETSPLANVVTDKEEQQIIKNIEETQEPKIVASAPVLAKAKSSKQAYDSQLNIMTGRIVDAENQPIIGAIIKTKNSETNTQTDGQGNFTILKESETDAIEVSAIGYKTQEIAFENIQKNEIVLIEDLSTFSEIKVSQQKAKTIPEAKAMQFSEPVPTMGWRNFDELLLLSVKQTGAVSSIRFEDPVTVNMTIERNGRVSKVEVKSPEISIEDSEKISKNIERETRWFPARKSGKKIRKQVTRQINPKE